MATTEYKSPEGFHRHQCNRCGYVWEHADDDPDTSHEVRHRCPDCGGWEDLKYSGWQMPGPYIRKHDMIKPSNHLMQVASQLMSWLEKQDSKLAHTEYPVKLTLVGNSYESLEIGDFFIWDTNGDSGAKELTFEACRNEFLRQIRELQIFLPTRET